ncbi:MAG: hypothetical protein AB8G11_15310 [Saprospiraceae bacterium]
MTEIIASQIFTKQYIPRFKILKTWQYSFIIIGTLMILGFGIFGAKGLMKIQEWLFNTSNGYFIPHNVYLFYIVIVGLGIAVIVLIALFFARTAKEVPLKEWDKYPEITSIHHTIKGLKNTGFFISLGLQIAFLFGMMDYVIVEDDKIIRNPLGNFKEEVLSMSIVKKATLTYNYRTERQHRSIKSNEVLDPEFNINIGNQTFNIWNSNLDLSDSIIEKIATQMYYKKVNIEVNYPGVMEKSKWRKTYKKEKFNRILNIYDYVTMLVDGTAEPIKNGNKIRVKQMEIQLDSALYSNQYNIFNFSNDEFLLTYFTITNHEVDTSYFGTILSLYAIDVDGKKYTLSSLIEDFGDAAIPPKTTVHLMRGFDVPKDKRKDLKIRYRPSIMNEQYIYFELE